MKDDNLIEKILGFSTIEKNSIKSLIAKYIILNLEIIEKISIDQVAKHCFCSKSSIVKFCKELNLNGFKELVRILMWEYQIYKVVKKEEQNPNDNKKYFEIINSNIQFLEENSIAEFNKVAEEIKKSKKIFLFGKSPNIHICDIFRNYLIKLNYNCLFSTDIDVQLRVVENICKDDICFVFSYSGLTSEMKQVWNIAKNKNAKTVILTSNSSSQMFQESDFKFLIKNNEEIFKHQRSSIISFNIVIMQILYSLNAIQ